ncbi:hypothetical protein CCANI_10990 [Corynebacterium canis]|nr:hypothetical protein CCANI_10990 [Corynebacterium canis]
MMKITQKSAFVVCKKLHVQHTTYPYRAGTASKPLGLRRFGLYPARQAREIAGQGADV